MEKDLLKPELAAGKVREESDREPGQRSSFPLSKGPGKSCESPRVSVSVL